ncbi:MAG: PspC domain-containing protein [Sphingomonas sp.]|nr:MAG: PspC domain-containing protein [Sphingomonas sp.]
MPASPSPLFDRPDTFFGVCEGLGQDLGFNANILRILLGVAVLWNPVVVISTYLVLGLAVALSRWVYPLSADQAAGPAARAR